MSAKGCVLAMGIAPWILCALSCSSHDGVDKSAAQTTAAVSLQITLSNEVGRLTSTGNGLRRTYYAYDARGRATATQHVLDGASYVFTSTYGFPCTTSGCSATATAPNGPVVVSSTFPDGESVTYTFDAGGAEQAIQTTPPRRVGTDDREQGSS
jgi:YD repeat-containing protein